MPAEERVGLRTEAGEARREDDLLPSGECRVKVGTNFRKAIEKRGVQDDIPFGYGRNECGSNCLPEPLYSRSYRTFHHRRCVVAAV